MKWADVYGASYKPYGLRAILIVTSSDPPKSQLSPPMQNQNVNVNA